MVIYTGAPSYEITELGYVLLMLLSDMDEEFFPHTKSDVRTNRYAREWQLLEQLGYLVFVYGMNGPETCALEFQVQGFTNSLARVAKVEKIYLFNVSADKQREIYAQLVEIGAIN